MNGLSVWCCTLYSDLRSVVRAIELVCVVYSYFFRSRSERAKSSRYLDISHPVSKPNFQPCTYPFPDNAFPTHSPTHPAF